MGDDADSIEAYGDGPRPLPGHRRRRPRRPHGRRARRGRPPGRSPRRRGRPPVGRAGGTGRARRPSCCRARTCCSSTSRPTTSTSPASTCSSSSWAPRSAAVVTVSHDRTFLDRVVTRILELRLPDHDAVEHAGGWTDFVAARELARRQQYEGYEKYTAERDRLQQRQRTQREWAVVGVKNAKAKKTDNDKFLPHLKSQRSEKMAAKAKATEKAIERLEVVDKPWEPWQLQLELKAATRAGRRGRPARSRHRGARLVPPRPDRPRGRLAGPPRHPRPQRLRQDDPAAGAARRGRRWPAVSAGSVRGEGRAARPAPAALRRRRRRCCRRSWPRPASTAARRARCWPSSGSAPTTSTGRAPTSRRASAPGRCSPSSWPRA